MLMLIREFSYNKSNDHYSVFFWLGSFEMSQPACRRLFKRLLLIACSHFWLQSPQDP
jgi:hypothetical protein